MPLDSKLIHECTDEYHKGVDRLAKLVRTVVERLETELSHNKIMARVSGRVKNKDSLSRKLEKWATQTDKSNLFNSKHDVFSNVGDLAAVRVMTYIEQDRARVADIAREVFAPRPGKVDFEYEVKENSFRIKKDDINYYRATHLQICLRDSDLEGENSNLKDDHCELQITSMLAHVWNEIEHDMVYKVSNEVLSEEEIWSIEALGLLTKSGDRIISNLIKSNKRRKNDYQIDLNFNNKKILHKDALSVELSNFYGSDIFGQPLHLEMNNNYLFQALKKLDILDPAAIFEKLTPSYIYQVKTKEIPEFLLFCERNNFGKPFLELNTCDIFLITLITLHWEALTISKSVRGRKPRHVEFAVRWKAFVQSSK